MKVLQIFKEESHMNDLLQGNNRSNMEPLSMAGSHMKVFGDYIRPIEEKEVNYVKPSIDDHEFNQTQSEAKCLQHPSNWYGGDGVNGVLHLKKNYDARS